jgi:hypothetical protein
LSLNVGRGIIRTRSTIIWGAKNSVGITVLFCFLFFFALVIWCFLRRIGSCLLCAVGDVFSITPQASRSVLLSLSEQLVGPAGMWTSECSAKTGLKVGTKAVIDSFLVRRCFSYGSRILHCLRFFVDRAFCLLKKTVVFLWIADSSCSHCLWFCWSDEICGFCLDCT